MRVQTHRPRLTAKVDLPGGQDRLRQIILYVSLRCDNSERFGRIKLNKIIWKADFDAFAKRRMPVTGRTYQRLELGPAPKEMKPILDEMEKLGSIDYRITDFGDNIIEYRPIAKIPPNLSYFSRDDLDFVDLSINYYWIKRGMRPATIREVSSWRTKSTGGIYEWHCERDN